MIPPLQAIFAVPVAVSSGGWGLRVGSSPLKGTCLVSQINMLPAGLAKNKPPVFERECLATHPPGAEELTYRS